MEVGVRLAVCAAGRARGWAGAADAEPRSAAELHQLVARPQLAWLLAGADVSLVALGRPAATAAALHAPQAVAPRFLADLFAAPGAAERAVHLAWLRLADGRAADLLGCGLARALDLPHALRLLRAGRARRDQHPDPRAHSVLTVSVQRGPPGARLATASFCELSSRPGAGLAALDAVVRDLLAGRDRDEVDYERSLLTAVLRDSFGGRALAWLAYCADGDAEDPPDPDETARDLAFCARCRGVRNLVAVDGGVEFDSVAAPERAAPAPPPDGDADADFGLRFAAEQWIKLVSNAEGLFRSILRRDALPEGEAERINEWLFLKAECDECLDPAAAGGEGGAAPRGDGDRAALPRIAEDTEPSEPSDSEADSAASSTRDGRPLADELRERAELFREETDALAAARCEAFLRGAAEEAPRPERRRTVRPGESLTGDELELLRRRAAEGEPAPAASRKRRRSLRRRGALKRDSAAKLAAGVRRAELRLAELVELGVAERRAARPSDREAKKRKGEQAKRELRISRLRERIARDVERGAALEAAASSLEREAASPGGGSPSPSPASAVKARVRGSLRRVGGRISRLDRALKEKAADLRARRPAVGDEATLRREIRNLRETRECLIDRRGVLGRKRKTHRSLSDEEERKYLEYEEAIEAIDNAIEFKNELICGRGPSLTEVDGRRERGEELLMERLDKLSVDETKTLLYKYFQKVIDLRTTCADLEAAAGAAQQEAGGWRRRCGDAWAALQHAHLNHARRTTALTARHYHALNRLMYGPADENESDASIYDANMDHRPQLEFPSRTNRRQIMDSDADNATTQHRIASTTAKFKVKENVVGGNARILDRIQNFANFHRSGIPSQNLKQLEITNSNPITKVTRQKNKLVIIQEDKLNK